MSKEAVPITELIEEAEELSVPEPLEEEYEAIEEAEEIKEKTKIRASLGTSFAEELQESFFKGTLLILNSAISDYATLNVDTCAGALGRSRYMRDFFGNVVGGSSAIIPEYGRALILFAANVLNHVQVGPSQTDIDQDEDFGVRDVRDEDDLNE